MYSQRLLFFLKMKDIGVLVDHLESRVGMLK